MIKDLTQSEIAFVAGGIRRFPPLTIEVVFDKNHNRIFSYRPNSGWKDYLIYNYFVLTNKFTGNYHFVRQYLK